MKNSLIAFALTASIFSSAPSAAAVNVNQLDQQRRIDAGNRSGKLSNAETSQLKAEQRSIVRQEAQMRARHGGTLTAHDRKIIHARQAKADTHILALKANRARGKNHLAL
jgi:hypothetical protein